MKFIHILVFSFFLFLYGVVYTVSTDDKNQQVELVLEQQIENLKNNYKVSTNLFKTISDNFYNRVLNKKEVLELFYRAKYAKTEDARASIRKTLYTRMKPEFDQLGKSGMNIMHFAFDENRSFLRVHKPSKYGDDLSEVRYSITHVNDKKKILRGFEQGKVSHAFRNIFPLYYENEYIGSVDLSFSSEVLQENMTKIHAIDTHFIVDKTIFDVKVWKRQNKVKYIKSIEHKDFLYSLTPSQKDSIFDSDKLELNRVLKDDISANIKEHEAFALYTHRDDKVQLITFFPIKNIKDKRTVAYLVSYNNSFYLEKMLHKYIWVNVLFAIGLLLLYFVIANNIKQRYYLQSRVSEALEKNRAQDKELLEQSKIAQDKLNKSILLFGENVISSSSDTKGIITYASPALCDISGYAESELLGKPHNILRHPDMPSEIFKEMWETIKAGKIWDGEVKNLKKSGESYWVRTSIMPDLDSEGNITGYRSIRHEITSQKVKEAFMANMSHELRTPLNAIIGFSAMLKKRVKTPKDNELVKHIHSSAMSLLMLINDILDLSKIQDSKFTIEPYKFDAYKEMIEYTKSFEGLLSDKDLKFKNKISKNLQGLFLGDWLRISQIILNLVSNSIKFTPKEGEISYEADYQDACLVLSIADDGIGMNQETQDKIFKPFEQADGSTTRKYGGTGLGLSITQNLVELMDGKIELESQEGVGSTFKVTIPLEKLKHEKAEENEINSNDQDRKKSLNEHILVAEDNKTNQILIKMMLEDLGLSCDIAKDGIEAVKMYDPSKYSLILMDENMPNMSGLQAMQKIQEKYRDKCGPIIALTANAMEGDREKFLKLGMDGYVSKPVDIDVLSRTINEFL